MAMFQLVPTKAQWRKWSLPSKLTCLGVYSGVLLGVCSILLTIMLYIWPPSSGESPAHKFGVVPGSTGALPVVREPSELFPERPREGTEESSPSKRGPHSGDHEREDPAALPERLTIRENSAAEVLRSLDGIEPYRFHEKVEELYLGRWTQESGWQATVDELPSRRTNGSWHCSFKEAGSGTLIFASTTQDISTYRPGDSVTVSGRIGRVSLLNSVSLEDATVFARPEP